MRVYLCLLLGLTTACSDEHRSARDAGEDGADASAFPRRDAAVPARDSGQPAAQSCEARPGADVALLVFQSDAARRTPPVPIALEFSATFTGVVTAHGDGFPSFDAPPMATPPDASSYRFLRVADGPRVWTLATRGLPDLRVREQAEVRVELKWNALRFGPAEQWLNIREQDSLAFFYVQEDALSEVPVVPGFRFRAGRPTCTLNNECGDVASFELDLQLPGGESVSLARGATASAAGYDVTHQETRAVIGRPGRTCPDYTPGITRFTLARSELPQPEDFECSTTRSSQLQGVQIEFASDAPCSFTRDEAQRGIELPFRIVVDKDIPGVAGAAPDIGGCQVPDAGMLRAYASLTGNGQYYGISDVGGCFGQPLHPGTLRAGSYPDKLRWNGVNWRGPSDTGEMPGAAFPAGIYTLQVDVRGYYDIADDADAGSGMPFLVSATRQILLRE